MQPGTQMFPFDLPEIHRPTSLKMFSVYLGVCKFMDKQTLNDELMNYK